MMDITILSNDAIDAVPEEMKAGVTVVLCQELTKRLHVSSVLELFIDSK